MCNKTLNVINNVVLVKFPSLPLYIFLSKSRESQTNNLKSTAILATLGHLHFLMKFYNALTAVLQNKTIIVVFLGKFAHL